MRLLRLIFNDYKDLESRLRQTASISFLFSLFTLFFGKVWCQNRQPNKSYSDFNCAKDIDIYRLSFCTKPLAIHVKEN